VRPEETRSKVTSGASGAAGATGGDQATRRKEKGGRRKEEIL